MDNFAFIILGDFLPAVSFFKSNGSAADFLAGYNTRTVEERTKYDEKEMCRSYGKWMMAMALPLTAGGIIDFFRPGIGSLCGWFLWVLLFILLMRKRIRTER